MGETQAPPLRLPPKEASPPSPFGPLGVSALDACDESQSLPLALTPRYAAHLSSPRRHSPPGMLKLRLPDVPFQSIDLQLPRDTLSPLLPLLDTGRPTTSSGFTHAANRMFEETRRFLESAESDGVDSMRPISSQPDGGGKTGWNPRSTCLHRPLACLSSEDHRELFDKQWKEVNISASSSPTPCRLYPCCCWLLPLATHSTTLLATPLAIFVSSLILSLSACFFVSLSASLSAYFSPSLSSVLFFHTF